MAFSMAAGVRNRESFFPSLTRVTALIPVSLARASRLESTAGRVEAPGSVKPSTSSRQATVIPVPMTEQTPRLAQAVLSM